MTAPAGPAVVVGQVGRDIVLDIDRLPRGGRATAVRRRQEVLGGRAAGQALALLQLGCPTALVGVLGNDPAGDLALAQAVTDGLWVSGIARRPGGQTALLVDLVEPDGVRRVLADVPAAAVLTAADVAAAAPVLQRARALVLHLEQPGDALLTALESAARGALLVADGGPPDQTAQDTVLRAVHVLRADALEAGRWVGSELGGLDDLRAAATELCGAGPRVVSLAAGTDGDLTVWRTPGGQLREQLVPPLGQARDQAGAGDGVVAALTVALLRGADPAAAAWEAGAAATLSAARPGGRTRLAASAVADLAEQGRRRADARR